MRAALLLLIPLVGCRAEPIVEWKADCISERDPVRRTALAGKISDSGDPRTIPFLIECLQWALKQEKLPPREKGVEIKPETVGPEVWALIVVTGEDFDRDVSAWKQWWEKNRKHLKWDSGAKRWRR